MKKSTAQQITILLLMITSFINAQAATVIWDGDAGDGLWGTATNWDGDVLPGSADDVRIENGDVVTLASGAVTIHSLFIGGLSDLAISPGATLTVNKTTNPGSGNAIFIDGSSELSNAGTLNVAGGFNEIYLNISTLTNLSGGHINLTANTAFRSINIDIGVLNNGGTISTTGNNFTIYAFLGTINNNLGGVFDFNNPSNKGIDLENTNLINDGTINITGGSGIGIHYQSNQNGNVWSNAGMVNVSNTGTGIIVNGTSMDNTGTIKISGTSGSALDNNLSGNFTNTGTLQGTGTFDMNSSSLAGTVIPGTSPGTMTFPADQTFSGNLEVEVDGTTPGTQHDQVVVNGTATISGTLNATINYAPSLNDRIVIISATAISGTFSAISPALPSDWSIDYSVSGEVALVYTFTPGIWDGDAGDGLWGTAQNWSGDVLPRSADDVVIDNGDAITLPSGEATIQKITFGGGSDLTVSAGATLNINNPGSGFTFFSPNTISSSTEITNAGIINITGGSNGVRTTNVDWVNQSGGEIHISGVSSQAWNDDGGGNINNSGIITIDGGVRGIQGRGTLTNQSGGSITVQNTSSSGISMGGGGTVFNHGIIVADNCGGTSISASDISNSATGNMTISNAAGGTALYPIVYFYNNGSITIMGAAGRGLYLWDTNFDNSGTMTFSSITGHAIDMETDGFPYSFSNTGTLKGGGTFNVFNDLGGTIEPGTSPGTMTYLNDQAFTATSTIEIEVDGTTPGTEHDQIVVGGTATISGTLNANINYTPSQGDRIVIISATAISGTFSSISPALPFDWEIDYSVTGEVALVYDYVVGKWDGEVGDGLWTSADNWEGGILPTASVDVVIDNGDAITLPSGEVTIQKITFGGGSDLTVSAGATLNINNPGSGFTFFSPNTISSSTEITNAGIINITGGSDGVRTTNVDWVNQSGGEIHISGVSSRAWNDDGGGNINNSGIITIDGGVLGIQGRGTLTNQSGGSITVQNTSSSGISMGGGGTVFNRGIMVADNCGSTSISASDISNSATGNMTISNAAGGTALYPIVYFYNNGSITITDAAGTGLFLEDTNFDNSGTITISGTTGFAIDMDTYGFGYTFSNIGTLKGTGTFDLLNDLGGTIEPGTSPGTMTYLNDQAFTGTLKIEVDGTTPDTEHDQIVVNGTATINGNLNATINYLPTNGDRIVILSATSISGTFSSVSPALPADWSVDYSVTGEVALLYSGVSLPVDWLSFAAYEQDKVVLLEWETASETNNSHFEVEWSATGTRFEKIGAVSGAGTATDIQFYDFKHERPASGDNYYRIKQVDFDGAYTYSAIRLVSREDEAAIKLSVYSNPCQIEVTVESDESGLLQVFDASGKLQLEQMTDGLLRIDVSLWQKGIYYMKIGQQAKQLIVQ